MRIITISPIYIPLELKSGIDPRLDLYQSVIDALPDKSDDVVVPNAGGDGVSVDFDDLSQDDYDLRLMVWTPKVDDDAPKVEFHIYSNGIASLILDFNLEDGLSPNQVETEAQEKTCAEVERWAAPLNGLLSDIHSKLPKRVVDQTRALEPVDKSKIAWTARTVIFNKDHLAEARSKAFIREWLAETVRPNDAQKIIDGELDRSITWVNYVIVDKPESDLAEILHVVRLSQFFFAAQYELNLRTQKALIEASFEKNIRTAKQMLGDAREKMQHLSIQFHVQRSFLRRSRKVEMDALLKGWDFDNLVENGERMVKASTSKIDQIVSSRSERSSFVTDLILAVIALLTVVELSLYFSEYSRKLMSNPALEYYDDDMSWLLAGIAAIDTDTVLLGGALSILTLVALYVYWKLKN
ncbi:MAG: hypothetical protein AAFV59_14950 [Pseudomonadota bacterium]